MTSNDETASELVRLIRQIPEEDVVKVVDTIAKSLTVSDLDEVHFQVRITLEDAGRTPNEVDDLFGCPHEDEDDDGR